jgi:hypothetical protein
MVRALDIVKLGKEVMTSLVRASRDLQGTIDRHIQGSTCRFGHRIYGILEGILYSFLLSPTQAYNCPPG